MEWRANNPLTVDDVLGLTTKAPGGGGGNRDREQTRGGGGDGGNRDRE